jgi:hypothetical protein
MGELVASIFELIAYATGEALIYIATLGKRRPRLPYDHEGTGAYKALLVEGSTWIGFVFWAAVIAGLLYVFAR